MELKDLKDNYGQLAKKYKLPSFKELNENFEIDKIEKETDYLLRLVRKVMMEKIVNSLNFLEILLNPVNAPRLYISYARSMSQNDRKSIEDIYSKLGELSLNSLLYEIDYNEKKEAEIISKVYFAWDSIKPSFREILQSLNNPSSINSGRKEKSYFG